MAVIRTVVNRLVIKAFKRSGFQNTVKRLVPNCPTDAHIANDMATCTSDLRAFTSAVTTFVENDVEKLSLEKAEMSYY